MGSARVSFIGGLVMLALTLAAVYAVQAIMASNAPAPEPRDDDDESTDH